MTHLHVLYETNIRDPVATLRKIADQIEGEEFGPVGAIALVVMGDTLEVFSAGEDSGPTSTACLLQAGAMRLIQSIAEHGR